MTYIFPNAGLKFFVLGYFKLKRKNFLMKIPETVPIAAGINATRAVKILVCPVYAGLKPNEFAIK